jgi:hypothetical protein
MYTAELVSSKRSLYQHTGNLSTTVQHIPLLRLWGPYYQESYVCICSHLQEDNDRLRADVANGTRVGGVSISSSGGLLLGDPAGSSAPLVVRLTKEQQAVLAAAHEAVLQGEEVGAEPAEDEEDDVSQAEPGAVCNDPEELAEDGVSDMPNDGVAAVGSSGSQAESHDGRDSI